MTATALALPPTLPVAGLQTFAVPPAAAPAAGLAMSAAQCVEQTAERLRLACRHGQLEDASTAARIALPRVDARSPHAALLRALAQVEPTLMTAPEERRLYLLRRADGNACGLMRLRDNGRIGPDDTTAAARWTLTGGDLLLCDAQGLATHRYALCGERGGLRIYLGEQLADGAPSLLQEVRCTYARLSGLDPELSDPFCGLYDTAAMVGAELPGRPALLLAAPHAGADRLAGALNRSSEVFFDGELLHPQSIRLAEGTLQPGSATTLHAIREKDAAWFARMMMGRSIDSAGRDLTAATVRGFTFAPAHSRTALDWALAEPSLRIVHVVRSNLLAEFADILAEQASGPAAALHFEPERFGRFVEMKQRYLAHLRSRLMRRDGDTVEVDGSRLNERTVAELLAFLTDAPDAQAFAAEAAAAPAGRVVDRFDNPQDVLPCLRAIGRPGWAEVEGSVPDAA